ncbi:MAG: hypothetical protein AB1716_15445 [Planctomycetota bacterium]
MLESCQTGRRLMPDERNRLLLKPLPEPPIAHAYHHWDEAGRTLTYTYNGRRIVRLHIPGTARVSFRHGSDGSLQSFPLHQQIYVMLTGLAEGERVHGVTTFELSPAAVNMRPRRAGAGEAVIGQFGHALLPHANAFYDAEQDLLIAWHGQPWRWLDQRLAVADDGVQTSGLHAGLQAGSQARDDEQQQTGGVHSVVARLEVELGPEVWVISIKPQYYRTHLGYHYHKPWQRRPKLKPITGWCTWEAYRRNLSEEKILAAADFFATRLRAYGFEYIQVDDGFEKLPLPVNPHGTLVEAWLEPRPEFPSGHAGLVRQIRARGLEPGIWTSAAIYNDAFAETQPDVLLKDADGVPLLGDWVKYVLDCTPATLARHVRPIYEGLRAAGYSYCKIDAIRHLHFDGMHEAVLLGLMTNEEAEARYRAFLQAARDGLGEDVYWLSSWGVMTQMVGLCDACRISQDAMPTWAGMQMQVVESARWFFTQRVLWLNDPDHVCVRAPFEFARTVLSLVALSGGLFMLSDELKEYDAERLRLVQRCIPPLATMTAETGPLDTDYAAFTWTKFHGFHVLAERPFDAESMSDEEARNQAGEWETQDEDHPFSTLWAIHLDNDAGRWCVVGRFAAIALRASQLPISALHLPAGGDYLVFDFWEEKYLGRVHDALDCPALDVGHCQVLAIRPALDRPQFLSSTRHVSQDAISVRRQAWDAAQRELTLELEGVCGTSESYWIHVPAGYALTDVRTEGFAAVTNGGQPDHAGGKAVRTRIDFPPGPEDRTTGTITFVFRGATELMTKNQRRAPYGKALPCRLRKAEPCDTAPHDLARPF